MTSPLPAKPDYQLLADPAELETLTDRLIAEAKPVGYDVSESMRRQAGSRNNNFRHGLSRHPLYGTWYRMLRRCENPDEPQYGDYGGRGITVCEEWHDPAVYIAYIERELGPRPEGMTLDRTDNDGDYGPGKVRWAPRSVQNSNQRRRPQRGYPVGASGYKGVRLHRQSGLYQALIHEHGRGRSLGYYRTPEEAARVYDVASRELSGDRARLNFQEEVQ